MKTIFSLLLIVYFSSLVICGGVWPHPQSIVGGNKIYSISPSFNIELGAITNTLLNKSIERYRKYIVPSANYNGRSDGVITQLIINIQSNTMNLQLGISERYNLTVASPNSAINADNVFGAMRALETFSQLITDNTNGTAIIEGSPWIIQDEPRFLHRGLLIGKKKKIIFFFKFFFDLPFFLIYHFLGKKILLVTIFLWMSFSELSMD